MSTIANETPSKADALSTGSSFKQPIRPAWWREASVYQIYPASFKDSTGSGRGDIPGIISKLDYIAQLGVDIVWLSPILRSPQVDMGYDISDYRDIDPIYGTMEDHDQLIKGLHDRGLRYVMDLVVNHTSDQHEWFRQSRSSKDNPYRDWYFWRPARYDEQGRRMPPNNWESAFSGSAWEWDAGTQEYYLHIFAKEQPDLNWENPKVVAAVHEIIRFWLDRGVDGFRMDVINFISKDPALPDNKIYKPGFLQMSVEHFACGPRLHEFLQGIGKILKEYDAFSVGEMPGVTDAREILNGVGQDRGELAMAFQFEIVDMDHERQSKWLPRKFDPCELKQIVNKWQRVMLENGGWNALYMENHDQGRTISRYCDESEEYRMKSSKLLASHLGFQSGTVFVYQGQELAQINVPKDWGLEEYQDLEVINHWRTLLEEYPDDKEKQAVVKKQYRLVGRDNARTPMQWKPTAEDYAGFSPEPASANEGANAATTKPWMSIHPDFKQWNAETLVADKNSSFHYWRRVLQFRKAHKDIFVYGDFDMLDFEHEHVVAYVRTAEGKDRGGNLSRCLVITHFGGDGTWWTVPESVSDILFDHVGLRDNAVIAGLRNYISEGKGNEVKRGADGKWAINLRPWEVVVALSPSRVGASSL